MIYITETETGNYWIGWTDDGEGGEFDRESVNDYFTENGQTPPDQTKNPDTQTLLNYYGENF